MAKRNIKSRKLKAATQFSNGTKKSIKANKVDDINTRSGADFVKRLQDVNRSSIPDWEDSNKVSTHKMSYAGADNGQSIVFPFVQQTDSGLHDYSDPKYNHGRWDVLDNAVQKGDTLMMSNKDAEDFTTNYKNHYPKGKTFDDGGPIDVGGGTEGNMLGGLTTALSGAAGVLGNTFAMANPLMDGAYQANLDYANQYKPTATSNDTLMDEWSNFSNVKHINKQQAGSKSGAEMAGGAMSGMGSGAAMGAGIGMLGGPIGVGLGAVVGGAIGGVSSFVGGLFGNKKAKNKMNSMNAEIDETNNRNFMNLNNKAGAIGKQNAFTASANYAAFGGKLNAGEYNTGLSFIGGGGTHESNPQGGVPIGVDPKGTPNMVEEGEVIFNDYVFSNRLAPDERLLTENKLDPKYKDHTFAMIAEKESKEFEERVNNSISQAGIDVSMNRLRDAQEQLKAEEVEAERAKQIEELVAQGMSPEEAELLLMEQEQQGQEQLMDPAMMEQMMAEQEGQPQGIDPSMMGMAYGGQMFANGGNMYSKGGTANPMLNPGLPEEKGEKAKSLSLFGATNLRYLPAVGSGMAAFSDMMGWTGKSDYTAANIVGNSANNLPTAKATHLGNYMSYNPMDRDFYQNKINAQAGASRRGVVNQSGGNRATAIAGLMAQDNNYMNAIGDLGRKSEEYNYAQKQLVEDFNRGTNQFNAQQDMQAQLMNMGNAQARMNARAQQAQMMMQEDAMSAQSKSANLSNFFNNLGGIGQEEFIMNQIKSNEGLYYNYGDRRDGKASYKAKSAANGGYLTIKNKKRKKK